jgi:signal transduction histidine kinase
MSGSIPPKIETQRVKAAARQQAEAADAARSELADLNATLELRVTARTNELRQANASLRELSARLLQLQDDERRRIARELHDSVGQLLAAIALNMAMIEKELDRLSPQASKAVLDNQGFVQQILRDIRTISHLLHPPLLDETGLPSALRWYVEEFSERSGTEVVLDCAPAFGRLPSNLETAIFRIVQECLGNIHRHSQSATATIRLDLHEGSARLVVSDQGRGISADKQRELQSGVRTGVGLRGMRERVAQLGGELWIDSGQHGTTVTTVLPCELPRSPA